MFCSKCGAELSAKAFFCPNCGSRILQTVEPDLNQLEDDLYHALEEEELAEFERQQLKKTEKKELDIIGMRPADQAASRGEVHYRKVAPQPEYYDVRPEYDPEPEYDEDEYYDEEPEYDPGAAYDQKPKPTPKKPVTQKPVMQQPVETEWDREEETRLRKQRKRRQKNMITAVLLIIIIAALCGGMAYYIHNKNLTSPEYLMSQANEAYSKKDYQTALDYAERTLGIEPENVEALVLDGKITYAMKDEASAEELFMQVLKLDSKNVSAYKYLLKMYDDRNDYNAILALKDDVTDLEILALFEKYMVSPPTFDKEAGTYTEFFNVKISTKQRNLKIYYTLDGSVPTTASEKYEGSVAIHEKGDVKLQAIAVDKEGNQSEVSRVEYTIELIAPNTPVVSPDGGRFYDSTLVTVTSDPGTTVYYTWDGSVPTADSPVYAGPFYVPEGNNIFTVVAIDEFDMVSEPLQCNFIYYAPVPVAPAPVAEEAPPVEEAPPAE